MNDTYHSQLHFGAIMKHPLLNIITVFLLALIILSTLSAQSTRDTAWVGYDKGTFDPLVTYSGKNIGTAYAHPTAGWGYALRVDLRDYGTKVTTNDFSPIEMSFTIFTSRTSSGIKNRAMTAYIREDSLGYPGKVLVTLPFTIVHRPAEYDTIIVLNLRPNMTTLRKKNPLVIGFEEGPTTTDELFTWMRSSYAPNTTTKSFDRSSPTGKWYPIIQPVFSEAELRPSYNLFFRIRYVGDKPINVENIDAQQPSTILLDQNFPNPVQSITTIRFDIVNTNDIGQPIRFEVIDLLGREMFSIRYHDAVIGQNRINLTTNNLANGVYRYSLICGTKRVVRSMIVLH